MGVAVGGGVDVEVGMGVAVGGGVDVAVGVDCGVGVEVGNGEGVGVADAHAASRAVARAAARNGMVSSLMRDAPRRYRLAPRSIDTATPSAGITGKSTGESLRFNGVSPNLEKTITATMMGGKNSTACSTTP